MACRTQDFLEILRDIPKASVGTVAQMAGVKDAAEK